MADLKVNRRLKKIIEEHYKISPFAFSQRYGDNRGVKTSAILRERNGVSNKMLDGIIAAYPEINRDWLLTGVGEMIKKPEPPKEDPVKQNLTQSDVDFSKIADACKEATKACLDSVAIVKDLAKSNNTLVMDQSKLIGVLVETLARIEEKIDKKGGDVGGTSHVATMAAQG